ncbi:SpoIIE family protein phosphatase [Streptomyces sp. TS71-3]|uniref:ATP-binding SpoIIE family protein phosphatase n=1 Tax=Streptomyces sp. TS71-3 TaxID=2733862 RepID=UPI001BB402B1|nr:SpoIIE family protein phosphatase [Streptomyces sp. TS71-3]
MRTDVPVTSQDAPKDASRDACLASALRDIHARLGPSTTVAYLTTTGARGTADGSREPDALAVAMAVDTPLGFTVTPGMSVDDERFSTARAHRTGRPVIRENEDVRGVIRNDPALIQYVPYAMMAVSVPVRTADRSFGALTLRWAPPRDLAPESLDFLVGVGDRLAGDLARAAEQGSSVQAPPVPLFIPGSPGEGESGSTGYLYRFQRLATALAAAQRTRDVVATTQDQVLRVFEGRTMALCLSDEGRLRVVGAAGFYKSDLRALDGLLLTRHAPEADATSRVEPLFFATGEELRGAYPGLDRYDDRDAYFFLPLIADGRAVGCCVMGCDRSRRPKDEDLALLMIMMGQVGQSLQRARAYEEEKAVARGMQQGLLPRTLPHVEEIASTARYLTATGGAEAGGDWYDVIRLPGGGIGLVVGDVEGHSLEAGGTMGQVRSAVRAYATEGHDPATVLDRSNRLLSELDTNLFATCCCLWLDLETGTATLASAGHPAPVITDPGCTISIPDLPVGPPLGVASGTVYGQTETTLAPGSIVALYTDGLVDPGHLGVDAGLEQLQRTLARCRDEDLEVLADHLVGDSRSGTRRDDDMALLLVRYEGVREGGHRRVARVLVQRRDVQHVRRLRRFLQELLPAWGLADLLDDMELLVSEVVTNSLIHADTEVDVRLRESPHQIRVEVRDSDPRPPTIVADLGTGETGDAEAESGRGLLIVDALASAWGSSPAGRGKTTWFELDARAATRG